VVSPTTEFLCPLLGTQILHASGDERHQELADWVGGSFDPDKFVCADVQFDNPDERWRVVLGGEDPEPGMRIDYQPPQ